MKRSGRIANMVKIFTDNPNQIFTLNHFCKIFDCAKSTISEDINIIRNSFLETEQGNIITIPGPAGGVKFTTHVDKKKCANVQDRLALELNKPFRFLGGGFLYTSDIMFNPSFIYEMASIFANIFENRQADYVVTIETKGIPLALMTAKLLNIPTVVVRREPRISEGPTISINYRQADYVVTIETKGIPLALMTAKLLNIPTVVVRREPRISEGPTISINYFSGSAGRMQKMSVSKKSVIPGSKALIIDDFMRAGGSIKGIYELLSELDVEVCGVGVAIASVFPEAKKISQYDALVYMGEVNEKTLHADIISNLEISKKFIDCKFSDNSI